VQHALEHDSSISSLRLEALDRESQHLPFEISIFVVWRAAGSVMLFGSSVATAPGETTVVRIL